MNTHPLRFHFIICLALLWSTVLPVSGASKTTIKLGSLAPEGTPFYDVIYNISNAWEKATDGQVKMKIYAGGVAGSEADMVRKMKIGQLHGASMSAMGLSLIDPGYAALQMPSIIGSEQDLARYRKELLPLIEKRLGEKGYQIMAHTDLGPLYFFTSKKVTNITDLMKLKLCTFATDKNAKEVWVKAGFNIIDLTSSEIMAALQTGMVDGFIHSPLYALSMQWFAKAKYMVKVEYGYVLAASVVSKKRWDKFDPERQKQLIKIADSETDKIQAEIKKLNDSAIPTMIKHGLEVFEPDKKSIPSWHAPIVKVHPISRGTLIPEDVYDKLMKAKSQLNKTEK